VEAFEAKAHLTGWPRFPPVAFYDLERLSYLMVTNLRYCSGAYRVRTATSLSDPLLLFLS